jgi:hypothetical protein
MVIFDYMMRFMHHDSLPEPVNAPRQPWMQVKMLSRPIRRVSGDNLKFQKIALSRVDISNNLAYKTHVFWPLSDIPRLLSELLFRAYF